MIQKIHAFNPIILRKSRRFSPRFSPVPQGGMNMGKVDTVMKNYLQDKARFADLFNGVFFGGRQVILPQELSEASESYVGRRGGSVPASQGERDRTFRGENEIGAVEGNTNTAVTTAIEAGGIWRIFRTGEGYQNEAASGNHTSYSRSGKPELRGLHHALPVHGIRCSGIRKTAKRAETEK